MKRRNLFLWARFIGWLRYRWNGWFLAKPLVILAIVVIGAWTVDWVYPKLIKPATKEIKKEKTTTDTKTTTSQDKQGGPENVKTITTTVTKKKEPNKTETTKTETTKTETTIKEPNKTEVRKTETTKTETDKVETIKPDASNPQPGTPPTPKDKKDETVLFSFWKIVGLYALVLFFWWGFKSRRQLVVEEFTLFTKNPTDKKERKDPHGLGALLSIELDRLKRLYRTVDEQRAVSTATGVERPLEVAFKGEDVSSLLKEAVSGESKVALGPLTIPAGSIMAMLGRIFQGPRLSGSLHVEEVEGKWERYILAARLVGGDRPLSWDVAKEIVKTPAAEKEPEKSEKSKTSNEESDKTPTFIYGFLVEELAYRVFTDLALSPNTLRWEATRAFSKGLRAYRDCLRTSKDNTLNLKRAEHHLMEAISIDEKMDLAYYNLGVVYTELARREAATEAFKKALELNKGRWESAFGLATDCYKKIKEKEDFQNAIRETIKWCELVRELKPEDARVLNLQGLAYIKRALEAKKARDADPANTSLEGIKQDFQESISSFKKAVDLAWQSFDTLVRRGEFASVTGRDTLRQQYELFIACLHNLAMAHLESAKLIDSPAEKLAKCQKAENLLGEALNFQKFKKLRMESVIPHLHYARGKIYLEYQNYDQALEDFARAIWIDPTSALFWAYQSVALVKAGKSEEEIQVACNKFLDSLGAGEAERRTLSERIQALMKEYGLHDNKSLQRLAGVGSFSEELKKQEDNVECLGSKYDDLKHHTDKAWECAQVAIKLCMLHLKKEKPEEAATYCQAALDSLKGKFPQEIKRQELRGCLARCRRSLHLRRNEEMNLLEKLKALEDINQSLVMNPLSFSLRKELGYIYFSLCRFAEARDALEDALFWDANDPEIYQLLGLSHFHLVQTSRDFRQSSQRTEGLEKAGEYLRNALALYGPEKTAGQEEVKKSHQIGQIHYWLGHVSLELNRPESAITSLMIAWNLQEALEKAWQEALERAPKDVTIETLPAHKKIPPDTPLWLGVAFLKNKNFNDAENLFLELAKKYESQPDKAELRLQARLHYVFSLAERRGDLKRALELITNTTKDLESLPENEHKKLRAFCKDCEGWIYYKQNNTRQAIQCLENAISLWADAGSYYRLAMAYESRLDAIQSASPDDKNSEKKLLVKKALECCEHAVDLDFRQEYQKQVQELEERLVASETSNTPTNNANDGEVTPGDGEK